MVDTRAADDWWHGLPPERRIRLFQWLTETAPHTEVAGQLEIPIPRARGLT